MNIIEGHIDDRQFQIIIDRFNRLSSRTIYPDTAIAAVSFLMADVQALLAAFGATANAKDAK